MIGGDTVTAEKFEELADETKGSFFLAAEAEDVPKEIKKAAKEIVEEAEKKDRKEAETDWKKIILYVVIGLAVALLVVIAIVVVIVIVLKKKR